MKWNETMKAILAAALVAGLSFVGGCGGGGGGSSQAAAPKSSIVTGKFVAAPSAAKAGIVPAAAGDPITVTVDGEPSITTTVGDDGTFTLRGLPAGSFTLVFTQGGATLGTLTFQEVAANQQITITVEVVGGEVVLVDQDRRGIGDAGVELEGLIEAFVSVDPAGDSKFSVGGRTVVVRPGVTAIRRGADRKTFADLLVGMRVHVKGAKVDGSTDVLAYEVIIQDSAQAGQDDDPKITICHRPGGDPSKGRTITVGSSAWPAHEAHGDTRGPC
jgi:hypothetical protein